jgi:putative endonuclease
MNTRKKGAGGEDQAVEYLLNNGYTIITRNYQSRRGEIDCIAESPEGTLVFIEVKSGGGMSNGHPFFWINKSKQTKIVSMAKLYLYEHEITSKPCRFDAIAVVRGKIEHMENAFLG